jgi:hypothetical protein
VLPSTEESTSFPTRFSGTVSSSASYESSSSAGAVAAASLALISANLDDNLFFFGALGFSSEACP